MPPLTTGRLCSLLTVLLTLVGPLSAQDGVESGRVNGLITDLADQPIVGAVVTLRQVANPGATPQDVETGSKGRWSMANLASGRWELVVKSRGFRTSRGWVDLREGEAPQTVTVALRPLGEVTPIFATNPQSVTNWIEMGNDLLEQGQPERARGEYEKALTMLPFASRPEVLRAIARTHYLQEHWEESISALEDALLIESEDETTRQLYRSVSMQLNRSEVAEAFLSELGSGEEIKSDPLPDQVAVDPALNDSRLAELPVEPPIAGRTGRYRTRFDQVSPLGGMEVLIERLGIDEQYVRKIDPQGGRYAIDEESFQVYVPEQQPPRGAYGLFIWISPLPFGGFASDEVRDVLEAKGLIWIGADHSGNSRPVWYRVLLALDAVHNAKRYYDIDVRRIYAAGYSGGGRVASTLAQLYPDIFRGGFSFFGCDYWHRVAIPHMPGAHWPAAFPPPSRSDAKAIRSSNRFVLLTGELDFNRSQTKGVYTQMKDDGFEHLKLLVIPGASHYHRVENEWIEQGIDFLDSGIESR